MIWGLLTHLRRFKEGPELGYLERLVQSGIGSQVDSVLERLTATRAVAFDFVRPEEVQSIAVFTWETPVLLLVPSARFLG